MHADRHALTLLSCIALVLACSTSPAGGTRAPSDDEHCADVAGVPHAYTFEDQDKAERAGCKVKRIYRGIRDPQTGEMRDGEKWVFCCR